MDAPTREIILKPPTRVADLGAAVEAPRVMLRESASPFPMKTFLPLGLCVVFAVSASGQGPAAPPRPHSLSLSVEPLSVGGNSTVSTSAKEHPSQTTGRITSYETTKTETNTARESVQITVHNFGTLPDTAQVAWYFVATPAKPALNVPLADQQSIFDKGSKTITLAPGGMQTFPVNSAEISSELKRTAKLERGRGKKGEVEETGSVLGGWMVRVVADGKTLDSRASRDKLAEIVKDDDRLGRMKGH